MKTKDLPGIIALFIGCAYLFCMSATEEINYYIAPVAYAIIAAAYVYNIRCDKGPKTINMTLYALLVFLPVSQIVWYRLFTSMSLSRLLPYINNDEYHAFAFSWLGLGSILTFSLLVPVLLFAIGKSVANTHPKASIA